MQSIIIRVNFLLLDSSVDTAYSSPRRGRGIDDFIPQSSVTLTQSVGEGGLGVRPPLVGKVWEINCKLFRYLEGANWLVTIWFFCFRMLVNQEIECFVQCVLIELNLTFDWFLTIQRLIFKYYIITPNLIDCNLLMLVANLNRRCLFWNSESNTKN